MAKKKLLGKKITNCFIYKRKWHSAKQYLKVEKKTIKMLEQVARTSRLNLFDDDLKSIFSLDDEQGPQSLFNFQAYNLTEN